jgi:hypothetical protein
MNISALDKASYVSNKISIVNNKKNLTEEDIE